MEKPFLIDEGRLPGTEFARYKITAYPHWSRKHPNYLLEVWDYFDDLAVDKMFSSKSAAFKKLREIAFTGDTNEQEEQ